MTPRARGLSLKNAEGSTIEMHLYRGRLTGLSNDALRYVSSVEDDFWLLEEDIEGTIAHDVMLHERHYLTQEELDKIFDGLWYAFQQIKERTADMSKFEDIHEAVETLVISKAGIAAGGKLHLGRSRNDQVATDLRLKVRREIISLVESLSELIAVLIERSRGEEKTIIPLYTHLRPAQAGSLAHLLLHYAEILARDSDRFLDCLKRVNLNPLGACAIGGTSINVDRFRTTSLLGFNAPLENSIDCVSSRDFMLEAASCLAILASNLSRIAEDLTIWSSQEFGFVDIPDDFAFPSSVMPQKKNPCVTELVRARTGLVYSSLIQLLTICKGVPSGYVRDLQEVKRSMTLSFSSIGSTLDVLRILIPRLSFNKERMRAACEKSFVLAIDLAERLTVMTGLPFRSIHTFVGRLVSESISRGVRPEEIQIERLKQLSEEVLKSDYSNEVFTILKTLSFQEVLNSRSSFGSPSESNVVAARERLHSTINRTKAEIQGAKELDLAAKKRLWAFLEKANSRQD